MPRLSRSCRLRRSDPPCERRGRPQMRADDHSDPRPNGIRWPRFVPRHTPFHSAPGGTLSHTEQKIPAMRRGEIRSPASPSAAREGREPKSTRLPGRERTRGVSFDHFIGTADDRLWDRQPQRLGSLEIDDQFESASAAGSADRQDWRPQEPGRHRSQPGARCRTSLARS